MELEKFDKYRVVFFTGPAQKVLSVEDCKVPNKKVMVFRSLLYIKRHQKNAQAKLFGKNSSRRHAH